MSKVSITAAAKLAGISRSYLYRKYITPGIISTEKDTAGNSVIDTAEILRAFGKIQGDSEQATKSTQSDTLKNDSKNAALQVEIQLLREQLTAAHDDKKWLQGKVDQLASQLDTATRLLEHRTAPEPPKKRRWWSFFKGFSAGHANNTAPGKR
jgi:hypothetical protein